MDTEKLFGKIQHPFMIRTFSKLRVQGNYLNISKTICKEPTANIILNRERLKAFLLKSRTKQGYPLSPLFNIVLEVLEQLDKTEK